MVRVKKFVDLSGRGIQHQIYKTFTHDKQKELLNTQVAICKENKMLDQRSERFNDSQFIKGTQI